MGIPKAWEPVRSSDSSRVPTGRRAGRETEEALPAAILVPVGWQRTGVNLRPEAREPRALPGREWGLHAGWGTLREGERKGGERLISSL